MRRTLQIALLGTVAFGIGWLTGQFGTWRASAQDSPPAPAPAPAPAVSSFICLMGNELAVRKVGEANFTKDTKKIGIEVYYDRSNHNTIYLTETGSVAAIAGPAVQPAPVGQALPPAPPPPP